MDYAQLIIIAILVEAIWENLNNTRNISVCFSSN